MCKCGHNHSTAVAPVMSTALAVLIRRRDALQLLVDSGAEYSEDLANVKAAIAELT